ncbi:MAG: discoidin domain-containing protein [Clostridia bacterium]|nr:discoidin domain-containing protein [Clostridia bacterium]
MKKLYGIIVILLVLVVLLAACGDPAETTTAGVEDTTAPTTGTVTVTTPAETTADPNVKREETEYYTAILDETKWVADNSINVNEFTYSGSGRDVYTKVQLDYKNYDRSWYKEEADGTKTTLKYSAISKMASIGAITTVDEAAKTVSVKVVEMEVRVQSSWKEVTAKAGSYLMFDFTCSLPMDFYITVTPTEGGKQSTAAYTQDGISVSGSNGTYKGIAKCTVPYSQGKTFYINICADAPNYPVLTSIPVHITAPKYDLPFQFIFIGDWEMIRDKSYIENCYEVLYNSYPRAYQRWAMGGEPLVLYIQADKNYDGVAYNAGDRVCVSVDFANSSPDDVGLFAHEFTHAVQGGYAIEYGGGWFTEAMADYGRFRFFHWGYDPKYAKIYNVNDASIRDFHGDGTNNPNWHGYAQHNWFMAYLDWVWPTTDKNKDGKITPDEHGLIDHIVYEAKMRQKNGLSNVSDDPHVVGSVFNNWVKEWTGYESMEAIRLKYVKELDEGTWKFTGFRDYQDNFLIENCYDIPDLTYPMLEKAEPTAPTHTPLATPVTDGTNLAIGSTIHSATTEGLSKNATKNLVDGDLTTRYQASVNKNLQTMSGVQNEVVIDLGAVKSFDTYTLVNAGISLNETFNTKEWEIFVSTDGKTYTAVDYQKDNTAATVSVEIGEQSARYIKIRLYKSDAGGTGTVRLFEFMLFDTKQ